MSQNNMMSFITLNDIHNNPIELNPSAIIMMQRGTYNDMPTTKLTLSFGVMLTVIQTPEQIAQLQMDTVAKVMESVMNTTYNMFDELGEKLDEEN